MRRARDLDWLKTQAGDVYESRDPGSSSMRYATRYKVRSDPDARGMVDVQPYETTRVTGLGVSWHRHPDHQIIFRWHVSAFESSWFTRVQGHERRCLRHDDCREHRGLGVACAASRLSTRDRKDTRAMRKKKRRQRDVTGGAPEYERVDSRGHTHRFRVVRVGRNTVDLAHVGTHTPGRGWSRGSGDVYPADARLLAQMKRVSSRDRGRGGSGPVRLAYQASHPSEECLCEHRSASHVAGDGACYRCRCTVFQRASNAHARAIRPRRARHDYDRDRSDPYDPGWYLKDNRTPTFDRGLSKSIRATEEREYPSTTAVGIRTQVKKQGWSSHFRIGGARVTLIIDHKKRNVSILSLHVPQHQQGHGAGSKALAAVVKYIDSIGYSATLLAHPLEEERGPRGGLPAEMSVSQKRERGKRLIAFYSRFGFVPTGHSHRGTLMKRPARSASSRDYEAETVGGWQQEHGGYRQPRAAKSFTAERYELLLKRHRRHKAYNRTQQFQGGRDRGRGRLRKRSRR